MPHQPVLLIRSRIRLVRGDEYDRQDLYFGRLLAERWERLWWHGGKDRQRVGAEDRETEDRPVRGDSEIAFAHLRHSGEDFR